MRHGKKFNHLGRKKGHRRALLANLSNALIEHKRIQTTVAKAKALRLYLEPLITKAKNNTTHSRRTVFGYLQNKTAVQELFDNVASKVADRPGGYLRIIRIGSRLGDGADLALIEFVDYNETYTTDKKSKSAGKKKRTRRGRSKSKQDNAATDAPKEVEATAEAVETAPEAIVEEATEAVTNAESPVAETESEEVKEEKKDDDTTA